MVLSSEEERRQEDFATKGKIWRIMVKNYFSREYLELSDVLCIFASDDILWHLNIKTKYYYNYEEVSTDYNPRPVFILCN